MQNFYSQLLLTIQKNYLGKENGKDLAEQLADPNINWRNLWETASKHKLQLVLQKVLKDYPVPIHPVMKRFRMNVSKRSLLKAKEIQRVLQAFEEKNIRITPYKGMAFAHCFYGGITMRNSVDMDVAIDLKDIPNSFAIMRSLGYVEYSKEKNGSQSNEKELHKSRAYYIDYSWVLYKGEQIKFNVELHYQPSHPVLHVPLYFSEIPDSAFTTFKIAGGTINSFTKPYLGLFTLIHHGLIDCWGQYRHIVDLAMMVKNLNKEDYQSFKNLLGKHQIQQSYYVGLYILENLLEMPIEDPDYQAARYQKIGDQLIDALQTDSLAGKWSENPKKLLYHLRLRDTFYQQLATGKNLLMFKLRF